MINVLTSAFITVFSIGLLIISLLSYKRYRNKKLLFVSGVFTVMAIKGLILTSNLLFEQIPGFTQSTYLNIFDLFILVLLYLATLKR